MPVSDQLREASSLLEKLSKNQPYLSTVSQAVELIFKTLGSGRKLLIAGNGGSAADAQHLAAEFVGRFRLERPGYPAIALTTDASFLTAWSNDYEFKTVFSRQIESLGEPNDIFIGFSTSGQSANVLEGLRSAKKRGLKTIGFTGEGGGAMRELADLCFLIPSSITARIQEAHLLTYHMICEEVEKKLAG